MTPRLSDDLERDARRFDALGGRDLGLDEVLGRARGIRRRRRATVLVAAAAVAALIAVPASLTLRTHEQRTTPEPAHRLPTIEKIGLSALPVGAEPGTGWVEGSTWHGADGRSHKLELPPELSRGHLVQVATVGDAVVSAFADDAPDGGLTHPVVQRPNGELEPLGPVSGGFATSPDGQVVAFVDPSGLDVTVVQDDGTSIHSLHGEGGSAAAAAVSGGDCWPSRRCAIWINDTGPKPRVWLATTPNADAAAPVGLVALADVSADGVFAGFTRIVDGGSCSRVQEAGTALWRTCDARFLAFSPDGEHLLGSAAYADGFGDTELKTFDARTGRPGLDLRTAEGATITRMRWEDDDHVLATVYEGNRWGVLRIGLDRTVEYAIAPVAGDDTESPFLLPE